MTATQTMPRTTKAEDLRMGDRVKWFRRKHGDHVNVVVEEVEVLETGVRLVLKREGFDHLRNPNSIPRERPVVGKLHSFRMVKP